MPTQREERKSCRKGVGTQSPAKPNGNPNLYSRKTAVLSGYRELQSPGGSALPLPWGPALWSSGRGAVHLTLIRGLGDGQVCTHLCDAGEGRAPHLLPGKPHAKGRGMIEMPPRVSLTGEGQVAGVLTCGDAGGLLQVCT